MNRREALGALGMIGLTTTASRRLTVHGEPSTVNSSERDVERERHPARAQSSLKQSVSRWCYAALTLDQLCAAAKEIGLAAIDLLDRNEWDVPKKYGLACAMANGFGTIPKGFNRPDQHDKLVADAEAMIPAAAAGVPNIVCFSGNRQGMSDGEGIANCVAGLERLAPTAERFGVTLCLELLNSKVDHRDYQCDHTAWGAEVVKGVASPRVKLLYDIYHMQIMEGDIVRTIRTYAPHIAHFHTGGVPGRNEIDDTQELNYHRIAQAVVETGFTGYLAHEFVPKRDPLASLRDAVRICAV